MIANVQITVIAYGLADDLVKLFDRVGDAPGIKWRLFLHSDIPHVEATCHSLIERYPNIYYYPYKVNRGLSRSWNEGISASYADGADVAMILNDDMLPGVGDVQRVAQAAIDHPEYPIVKCMGLDMRSGQRTPMEFGLTAITKQGWRTVGAFDENIWPIYWEDIDWDYRRRLSGQDELIIQDTTAVHAGSKTSVTVPGLLQQTDAWYNANLAYYRRKWGRAHTEGEIYDVPFDDLSAPLFEAFPFYISTRNSSRPYGRHDREDVKRG